MSANCHHRRTWPCYLCLAVQDALNLLGDLADEAMMTHDITAMKQLERIADNLFAGKA